ncbi:hypothetical protein B0H66DRAFT_526782 [Apodospora peruviana]|uniref:Uncharacterized protein n=1 Tax=Apodospora peruviana TaxID=516989 RepID=A0AAE0IR28_9PEZI|nr:hypothetical protein B0H66DRAFT_526782 [Apodospora peruviana]
MANNAPGDDTAGPSDAFGDNTAGPSIAVAFGDDTAGPSTAVTPGQDQTARQRKNARKRAKKLAMKNNAPSDDTAGLLNAFSDNTAGPSTVVAFGNDTAGPSAAVASGDDTAGPSTAVAPGRGKTAQQRTSARKRAKKLAMENNGASDGTGGPGQSSPTGLPNQLAGDPSPYNHQPPSNIDHRNDRPPPYLGPQNQPTGSFGQRLQNIDQTKESNKPRSCEPLRPLCHSSRLFFPCVSSHRPVTS